MVETHKPKIGLITCHRIPNHGSFLQAWSLCEYLDKRGYNIEIIDYIYPNLYHLAKVHHNEITRNTDNSTLLKRLKRYVIDRWFVCNRKRGLELLIYRLLNFALKNPNKLYFRELNLSSQSFRNSSELKQAKTDYDVLISGSDQIWNPRFSGADDIFFLQFGKSDVKRIAYSSSFGVSDIEPHFKKLYSGWLNSYSHIATREQTGCELAKELCGKDAIHVLDPVMLFTKKEWLEILSSSNISDIDSKPYIVSYCLDYVYKGIIDYADSVMAEIASNLGLKCMTLYKSNMDKNNVRTLAETIHPFEFVNTIMHADFTLVSSFHGLAFSILFHKPFYVIMDKKETPDSRITDLLNTFGLQDRILTNGDTVNIGSLKDIDWDNIDKIYDRMSTISRQYIANAINE